MYGDVKPPQYEDPGDLYYIKDPSRLEYVHKNTSKDIQYHTDYFGVPQSNSLIYSFTQYHDIKSDVIQIQKSLEEGDMKTVVSVSREHETLSLYIWTRVAPNIQSSLQSQDDVYVSEIGMVNEFPSYDLIPIKESDLDIPVLMKVTFN